DLCGTVARGVHNMQYSLDTARPAPYTPGVDPAVGTSVGLAASASDAPARSPAQGHRTRSPYPHDERETAMATTARTSAPHRVPQTSDVGKLLDLIRQQNIQVVDVKFCDLPGTWQHF